MGMKVLLLSQNEKALNSRLSSRIGNVVCG